MAEVGRSWSYSWGCQYWISSRDQSHSLFHGSFWKLFRIKHVEEKSTLCQTAGCCLNTHQGKAGKAYSSPRYWAESRSHFLSIFSSFPSPKKWGCQWKITPDVFSFLRRCLLTQFMLLSPTEAVPWSRLGWGEGFRNTFNRGGKAW